MSRVQKPQIPGWFDHSALATRLLHKTSLSISGSIHRSRSSFWNLATSFCISIGGAQTTATFLLARDLPRIFCGGMKTLLQPKIPLGKHRVSLSTVPFIPRKVAIVGSNCLRSSTLLVIGWRFNKRPNSIFGTKMCWPRIQLDGGLIVQKRKDTLLSRICK